jgi:hypothetical protein
VVGDEDGDGGADAFARANDWMIEAARSIDPRPHVIAVWDGQCGDGPGGTADMIRQLGVRPADPRVRLIAPIGRSGAR